MAHRQERRPSYWSGGRLTCTTTAGTLVLTTVCCCWCFGLLVQPASCGNPDAKRLYDDLLSNYNKIVRPVVNNSDVLKVRIKLKLSQLIDLNLKNQIMTTNLWVEQYWYDYKLMWEPSEYGEVSMLHVPSDHIWRPDISLYNNADGHYELKLNTKAIVHHNGLVAWQPPATYKSACDIDVEYFPLDIQTCFLKLGTWTYAGYQVDLRHLDEVEGSNIVDIGMDLSEFYMSVEWDILEVPAVRSEKFYTCCVEPYLDITFNITMRRKTLFYTVNLIIPCMGISFLTILTFYLPSDSGEKVTLSISILISLHVFFLLVVEIIPPTSLVVPLLGKYLIFAMILVSISICVTVVVLNVHFRSPQTHRMAPWVRRVFIHILPRLLAMRRPQCRIDEHSKFGRHVVVRTCNGSELRDAMAGDNGGGEYMRRAANNRQGGLAGSSFGATLSRGVTTENLCRVHGYPSRRNSVMVRDDTMSTTTLAAASSMIGSTRIGAGGVPSGGIPVSGTGDHIRYIGPNGMHSAKCSADLHRSCFCVRFIAEHTRLKEESLRVREDWKYVAMVLDRLFLWIFTLAVLVGTAAIILQAPSLYDDREPIDQQLSEIFSTVRNRNQQNKNPF
ncbi:acetylcholine receptor subunit alpha-like isoform X1 [Daphnia pulicaria]|uniref:acetylcholine receptor subunit alpha-like isoform X1 n=1 Tax=Daphnia pulicaria TaxID=35523 RepID=UPI001EEC7FEA|nr:acetylcholine receptor subunit alpha-like isoform X1 [Daphnia pulicaria]